MLIPHPLLGPRDAQEFTYLGDAALLAERFNLPVLMIDERSSSIEAAQRFAAARAEGQRRRRDAAELDAVAAAVIIERWIAAPDSAAVIHHKES